MRARVREKDGEEWGQKGVRKTEMMAEKWGCNKIRKRGDSTSPRSAVSKPERQDIMGQTRFKNAFKISYQFVNEPQVISKPHCHKEVHKWGFLYNFHGPHYGNGSSAYCEAETGNRRDYVPHKKYCLKVY